MPSVFRDVSGKDPESPWISGFRSDSSSWERGPEMQLLWQLLCYSTLNFLRNFSDIILLWSGNICVFFQVVPRMLLTILRVQCCKFSLILRVAICHGESIEQRLRLNYLFNGGNKLVDNYNICRREKQRLTDYYYS